LPPPGAPSGQLALRARLAPLRTRLDHHHLESRLRAMGRDPRRRDGRRRPDRPARPPRDHDRAQGQELPPPRAWPRRRARRSGSVAPRLRLNGGSRINPTQARIALSATLAAKLDATGTPLTPREHPARPPTRPEVEHFSTAQ